MPKLKDGMETRIFNHLIIDILINLYIFYKIEYII